ncbi:MAG: hypothetical protein GY765_32835, partial [bacterium]|nr:hypothetical protein [bacterium]
VRTVFQDRRGDIWLGTVGGGISRFRNGRFKNFGIEDGLKNNSVWTIAEGKDNTIWFGTYGGGLHRINTENDNIRVLTTKDGLANNIIRVVFVDDEGKVWVGSNGGGVDVMANGKISNYNSKNGLSDDFVYTIAQWQGAMWIGTYGAGLNRLKDGEFTHYGLKDGLTDAAVWALYPDSSGSLWIGTNGGGLHRLKNGKFTRFSMAHGLCSDLTFKIMEDGLGFLWMNSNRGIYKVALDELEKVAQGSLDKVFCFSYGREEGIKYTESSGPAQPAGCRTTDGKLWFPGVKGIIVMDPGSTKKNEIAPP